MKKKKRRVYKKGLNTHGQVAWGMSENLLAILLAQHGLHARAIAQHTGLSTGQINYRNRKQGLKLRDYRDGKGPVVQKLVTQFTVHKIDDMSKDQRGRLLEALGIEP